MREYQTAVDTYNRDKMRQLIDLKYFFNVHQNTTSSPQSRRWIVITNLTHTVDC